MSRVTESAAKRLFAVSGNQCAFPRCTAPLVEAVSSKVTGRICHIKARSPKGPRYDAQQSEAERHDFTNLVLLCPTHHDVVDADEEAYTVERLQRIKADHERSRPAETVSDELAHALVNVSLQIGEGTINVQGQTGGQFAQAITNVFPRDSSANHASKHTDHDIRIFREADELFNEEMASRLFSDLLGGHEYYEHHSSAIYRFQFVP